VATLLGDEPVVGTGQGDCVEEEPLGVAVGVRHHVGGAALGVDAARRPTEPAEQELARRMRRAYRQLEEGFGSHSAESRWCPDSGHIFTCKCWTSGRTWCILHAWADC
jgi:hypothetical protein